MEQILGKLRQASIEMLRLAGSCCIRCGSRVCCLADGASGRLMLAEIRHRTLAEHRLCGAAHLADAEASAGVAATNGH